MNGQLAFPVQLGGLPVDAGKRGGGGEGVSGEMAPEGCGGEGFSGALEEGVEGTALIVHELDADLELVGGFAEGAEVVAGHIVEGGDVKFFVDAAFYRIGGTARDEVEVALVEGVIDFNEDVLGGSGAVECVVEADGVEDGSEKAGDGDEYNTVGLRVGKVGGQLLTKRAGAAEIVGRTETDGAAGAGTEAFNGLANFG